MDLLCSRVMEIMRMDAQKDPSVEPDAARARLIVDQVLLFCQHLFKFLVVIHIAL